MTEAEERKAFEADAGNQFDLSRDSVGKYYSEFTDYRWNGWKARAALSAPAVPEGWKLVPIEPTREMMAAAVRFANGNAVYKNVKAEALKVEEDIYGEVYEAMLAAAPSPQEQT